MNLDLFEWRIEFAYFWELSLAFALALPIGWDREREVRSAGLRTFPLVAIASCAYVLLGRDILADDAGDAMARVLYGLMTGIGFIGGGAILKGHGVVLGTATAAAIWSTGALGAAVAFHRYDIAATLTLFTFVTLRLITPLKTLASNAHDTRD